MVNRDEDVALEDTLLADSSSDAPSERGLAATVETGATPTSADRSKHIDDPGVLPHLDRFALLGRLGQGGMGTVYAAFDRRLDRKIAIKVLNDRVAADPEHRTRMLREAQAMARLSHPNVIPVFEVGEVDERVYVAMEFVDGPTLAAWQAERRPWQELVAMYVLAGRGLAAAHERGLIHRDFKPHNVLIGSDGRPRVIDFGLARLETSGEEQQSSAPSSPTREVPDDLDEAAGLDSPLTRAGAVMGTPAYMAPEQMLGEGVGPASDQFSFCMALYEALHGQRPSSLATMLESLDEAPGVSPSDRVPPWIHDAIVRGLARESERRWPSLDALLDVLDQDPAKNPSAGWKMRVLMTATLLIIAMVSWPLVQPSQGSSDVTPLDLALLAVFSTLPLLAVCWIWWERIARAERSKHLVQMAIAVMLALVVHRLIAWKAGFTVPQVILDDHLLIATSAALMARSVGAWMWLVVPICLAAALAVTLRPEWAVGSFGAMSVLSLTIACVGSLRRPRQS